jgi:hypothetical protein
LSATRDLTRRVRLTQRGGWFPLLVFAAVTLVAAPFYRYGHPQTHCASSRGGGSACLVFPTLALWYWPAALLVAYAAVSWFYVRRARERGVGSRAQPYVAVGAVMALVATAWALWANAHPAFLAETLDIGRVRAGAFLYRIASPAGAIGLALLLLAWIERSWSLFTLTVAYLIVVVATVGIGWLAHPTPWAFLPHLLLDGTVLLLGGILLALAQRAHGPSSV